MNLYRNDNTVREGQVHVVSFYYMAQVTSGKITRCDWLPTWHDFSVTSAGIMKLLIPYEQKQTQNPKEIMSKEFLRLKTKQNTEMSDEEHSNSEFYYPKEQVPRNGREER